MKENVIAVIPAFNEEDTISEVIQNLNKYVDKIVVVDDGSSDKTYEIAKNNSAVVVKHEKNLGYDKSIDGGFKKASELNPSIIFTFDADGQHLPSDVPNILSPIKSGSFDVVIGIRPYKQRISEKMFSRYAKKKIGISDPLCGIKAYSLKAYNKIGYFDKINSIGTELMFNCYKHGFKITEVKINMNERKGDPRFGKKLRGNFKIFLALIKIYLKFR